MALTKDHTGDSGDTSICRKNIKKTSCLVENLGDIDTLNSALGLARSHCEDDEVKQYVKYIQAEIFKIGSELAGFKKDIIDKESTKWLDKKIKRYSKTKYFHGFYIPGSTKASAFFDMARAVCRRAERSLWRVYETKEFDNKDVLVYLNRLSGLLWFFARRVGDEDDTLQKYKKSIEVQKCQKTKK